MTEESVGALCIADVVTVLELAADDTADASGRLSAMLRTAGLGSGDVAAVEDGVRRLQATTARWRRRGKELSALFSSAHELAELTDVNALLERLVERAHDLMGTEVTYLSEFDERSRELRVRMTRGTVVPGFATLRVPPGKGLAGLVAETAQAQWTSSYARMAGTDRDIGLDVLVHREGLVSMLGVPLSAGGHVLGVLFAANRVEHSFTPEEVALLSAFADHAAVVLQTARLFDQTRRAAEETRTAYAELSRHAESMERATDVHEELTAVVLRGGSAVEIAETLGTKLKRPVALLDAESALLAASSGSPAPPQVASGALREAIAGSRHSGRFTPVTGADCGYSAVVAIVAGETFLGVVLVGHGECELGPVERNTVERAAQIAALLTLQQTAVVDAEERVRGELLADLLDPDPVRRRDLHARARSRNVALHALRVLVVIAVQPEDRRAALRAAHRSTEPDGLTGEHEHALVAVSVIDDPRSAADAVRDAVRPVVHGPVLTVAAPVAADPAELPERFRAAERCAQLLPALGVRDGAVLSDTYLPYAALFGPDQRRLRSFIDETIGPVLRWDADRATDLVHTLRSFVDHGSSPTRTARDLHLHTNTVLQRLDRVTALLGPDWRNPEPLFRITLALRLHELSGS